MRKRSLAISERFLLLFILLVFPLMVLSALIINSNAALLQKGVTENTRLSLSIVQNTLEQRVQTVQNRLQNLVMSGGSPEIRTFYAQHDSLDDAQYFLSLREIRRMLHELTLYEELFSATEVHYPTLGLSVHSRQGVYRAPAGEYERLLQASMTPSGVKSLDNALLISASLPSVINSADECRILLVAWISPAELSRILSSIPYSVPASFLRCHGSGLCFSTDAAISPDDLSADTYTMFASQSDLLNCTLLTYLPTQTLFRTSDQLLRLMWMYLLLVIPLFAIYSIFARRKLQQPIQRLLEAMNTMRDGTLNFRLTTRRADAHEFAQLTEGFNEMLDHLETLIQTKYQLELDTRRLELKHLQAQINPHFLYNSLYMLRHMVDSEDNESASVLANHLGDYFRYLTASDQLSISLEEEYAHALTYLQIQSIRFGARLMVAAAPLPEEWKPICVPRLIIQPLYENALQYAMPQDNGQLVISTSFRQEGGQGIMVIEDSGSTLTDDTLRQMNLQLLSGPLGKVSALGNINRRLRLYYNVAYDMSLSRSELGGLRAQITIPLGKD